MTKRTAATAGAGAAAPASGTTGNTATPSAHVCTPRDEFTGIGGSYLRDPVTGVRTRVPPEAPASGDGTAAA